MHDNSVNEYTVSLFNPRRGECRYPDGGTEPSVTKRVYLTSIIDIQDLSSAGITNDAVLLWRPYDTHNSLSYFRIDTNGDWVFMHVLPVQQDLSKAFLKSRLVSAQLDVKSDTRPGGTFDISGRMNGVCIAAPPADLDRRTYETCLSMRNDEFACVSGVGITEGVSMLAQPRSINPMQPIPTVADDGQVFFIAYENQTSVTFHNNTHPECFSSDGFRVSREEGDSTYSNFFDKLELNSGYFRIQYSLESSVQTDWSLKVRSKWYDGTTVQDYRVYSLDQSSIKTNGQIDIYLHGFVGEIIIENATGVAPVGEAGVIISKLSPAIGDLCPLTALFIEGPELDTKLRIDGIFNCEVLANSGLIENLKMDYTPNPSRHDARQAAIIAIILSHQMGFNYIYPSWKLQAMQVSIPQEYYQRNATSSDMSPGIFGAIAKYAAPMAIQYGEKAVQKLVPKVYKGAKKALRGLMATGGVTDHWTSYSNHGLSTLPKTLTSGINDFKRLSGRDPTAAELIFHESCKLRPEAQVATEIRQAGGTVPKRFVDYETYSLESQGDMCTGIPITKKGRLVHSWLAGLDVAHCNIQKFTSEPCVLRVLNQARKLGVFDLKLIENIAESAMIYGADKTAAVLELVDLKCHEMRQANAKDGFEDAFEDDWSVDPQQDAALEAARPEINGHMMQGVANVELKFDDINLDEPIESSNHMKLQTIELNPLTTFEEHGVIYRQCVSYDAQTQESSVVPLVLFQGVKGQTYSYFDQEIFRSTMGKIVIHFYGLYETWTSEPCKRLLQLITLLCKQRGIDDLIIFPMSSDEFKHGGLSWGYAAIACLYGLPTHKIYTGVPGLSTGIVAQSTQGPEKVMENVVILTPQIIPGCSNYVQAKGSTPICTYDALAPFMQAAASQAELTDMHEQIVRGERRIRDLETEVEYMVLQASTMRNAETNLLQQLEEAKAGVPARQNPGKVRGNAEDIEILGSLGMEQARQSNHSSIDHKAVERQRGRESSESKVRHKGKTVLIPKSSLRLQMEPLFDKASANYLDVTGDAKEVSTKFTQMVRDKDPATKAFAKTLISLGGASYPETMSKGSMDAFLQAISVLKKLEVLPHTSYPGTPSFSGQIRHNMLKQTLANVLGVAKTSAPLKEYKFAAVAGESATARQVAERAIQNQVGNPKYLAYLTSAMNDDSVMLPYKIFSSVLSTVQSDKAFKAALKAGVEVNSAFRQNAPPMVVQNVIQAVEDDEVVNPPEDQAYGRGSGYAVGEDQ